MQGRGILFWRSSKPSKAKQLFKQLKAGEKTNNQPQAFAAIDEEEFEAFFTELQKEDDEN